MSEYVKCPVCQGKGYIKFPGGDIYNAIDCGACNGTGSIKKGED